MNLQVSHLHFCGRSCTQLHPPIWACHSSDLCTGCRYELIVSVHALCLRINYKILAVFKVCLFKSAFLTYSACFFVSSQFKGSPTTSNPIRKSKSISDFLLSMNWNSDRWTQYLYTRQPEECSRIRQGRQAVFLKGPRISKLGVVFFCFSRFC